MVATSRPLLLWAKHMSGASHATPNNITTTKSQCRFMLMRRFVHNHERLRPLVPNPFRAFFRTPLFRTERCRHGESECPRSETPPPISSQRRASLGAGRVSGGARVGGWGRGGRGGAGPAAGAETPEGPPLPGPPLLVRPTNSGARFPVPPPTCPPDVFELALWFLSLLGCVLGHVGACSKWFGALRGHSGVF